MNGFYIRPGLWLDTVRQVGPMHWVPVFGWRMTDTMGNEYRQVACPAGLQATETPEPNQHARPIASWPPAPSGGAT